MRAPTNMPHGCLVSFVASVMVRWSLSGLRGCASRRRFCGQTCGVCLQTVESQLQQGTYRLNSAWERGVSDYKRHFLCFPLTAQRETVTVKHTLALSSAYEYRNDVTTFHKGFKGVVDYLLYTRDCLRLEGVLQLIPAREFRCVGVGL